MKVKAKTSFAGIVTMAAGETRDIPDAKIVKDLVQAGYVEEVKSAKAKKEKGDTDENQ